MSVYAHKPLGSLSLPLRCVDGVTHAGPCTPCPVPIPAFQAHGDGLCLTELPGRLPETAAVAVPPRSLLSQHASQAA